MADAPENEVCIKFADYVLEHFVLPTCNYPLPHGSLLLIRLENAQIFCDKIKNP